MKTFIALFLCLSIPSYLLSQTVKLDILTETDEKILEVVFFNSGQEILFQGIEYADSIHFAFNREIDDGYTLIFQSNDKQYKTFFWLGTGEMDVQIKIEEGKVEVIQVKGSKLNITYQNYIERLVNKEVLEEEKRNWLKELLLIHNEQGLSCHIAMNYINKVKNDKEELKWLAEYLSKQPDLIKEHTYFSLNEKQIFGLLRSSIDLTSYKFVDKDDYLTKLDLGEEEVVILDFWFVRCPPCVRDHKAMKKDFEEGIYTDKSIRFVGISIDRGFEEWKRYLQKLGPAWENLKEDYSQKNTLHEDLGIYGFPTYLILDKEGKILKTYNAYNKVFAHLFPNHSMNG